jgi:hypothetical protein
LFKWEAALDATSNEEDLKKLAVTMMRVSFIEENTYYLQKVAKKVKTLATNQL